MGYKKGKQCPFNEGIDCPERAKCASCGWNPEVRNRRQAKLSGHKEITPCPFNEAIDCRNHAECDECGWNPLVAERREAELMEELGLDA